MKKIIFICITICFFSCNVTDDTTNETNTGLEYCISTGVFGLFSNFTQDWDNFVILHKAMSPKGNVKFKINSKKLKDNVSPINNLQVNGIQIPPKTSGNGSYKVFLNDEYPIFSDSDLLTIDDGINILNFSNDLDISFIDMAENYDPNSDFVINWQSNLSCSEVFIWVFEEDTNMQANIGDKLGGKFYFTDNDGSFTVPKEIFSEFDYDMQILIAVGKMLEKDNNAYVSVTSRYSPIISKTINN